MGTLLNSGYAIEDVLDLSFEQIKAVASCIIRHKVFMINSVAEPLSQALSGNKKPNKPAFNKKKLSPEEKEKRLLSQIGSMGFNV
jgi:hypothetical protein